MPENPIVCLLDSDRSCVRVDFNLERKPKSAEPNEAARLVSKFGITQEQASFCAGCR